VHLPDSFLSPAICAGSYCVAAAGLSVASRRITGDWNERTVPLLGVMSAFVFAGQMVNFPVAGGTSGHLLGGMLAAVLLGPHAAAMVLATVLGVQCLFFQDGGITTLGANWLNLALIGVYGGYATWRLFSRWFPGVKAEGIGLLLGAWTSVVLASAACALELAASGKARLSLVLPAMLLTHAVIGAGEAIITVAVVTFVARVRPDLVYRPGRVVAVSPQRLAIAGLVAAFGIALLLSPLASSLPDGLDWVAQKLGFGEPEPSTPAPMADYQVPGVDSKALSTVLAALIGTCLCLGAAWGGALLLSRALRRSSRRVES
jgi:cobalt/nickel transport system permease protein